jgi:hypothetical protein
LSYTVLALAAMGSITESANVMSNDVSLLFMFNSVQQEFTTVWLKRVAPK